MPKMQGVHAGRVWHVPLLQGHEEVWWAWPHEAVLRPSAMLSGESAAWVFPQKRFCVADQGQGEEGKDRV